MWTDVLVRELLEHGALGGEGNEDSNGQHSQGTAGQHGAPLRLEPVTPPLPPTLQQSAPSHKCPVSSHIRATITRKTVSASPYIFVPSEDLSHIRATTIPYKTYYYTQTVSASPYKPSKNQSTHTHSSTTFFFRFFHTHQFALGKFDALRGGEKFSSLEGVQVARQQHRVHLAVHQHAAADEANHAADHLCVLVGLFPSITRSLSFYTNEANHAADHLCACHVFPVGVY